MELVNVFNGNFKEMTKMAKNHGMKYQTREDYGIGARHSRPSSSSKAISRQNMPELNEESAKELKKFKKKESMLRKMKLMKNDQADLDVDLIEVGVNKYNFKENAHFYINE